MQGDITPQRLEIMTAAVISKKERGVLEPLRKKKKKKKGPWLTYRCRETLAFAFWTREGRPLVVVESGLPPKRK